MKKIILTSLLIFVSSEVYAIDDFFYERTIHNKILENDRIQMLKGSIKRITNYLPLDTTCGNDQFFNFESLRCENKNNSNNDYGINNVEIKKAINCPLNSTNYGNICYCNAGYKVDGNRCVLDICPLGYEKNKLNQCVEICPQGSARSFGDMGSCICKKGYVDNKGVCINLNQADQVCKSSYGEGAINISKESGSFSSIRLSCGCIDGYWLNEQEKTCVKKVGYLDKKIHIVMRGESLDSIARQYNIKTGDLARWNAVLDNNSIKEGQKLKLGYTSPLPLQIQVTANAKIDYLAKQFNISIDRIKQLNNLQSNEVPAGTVLTLFDPARNEWVEAKDGDTLEAIAKHYDITKEKLIELNPQYKLIQLEAGGYVRLPREGIYQYKESEDNLKSLTPNEVCERDFGMNSVWNGTKNSDGTINCTCKSGYIWNTSTRLCIQSSSGQLNSKEVGRVNSLVNNTELVDKGVDIKGAAELARYAEGLTGVKAALIMAVVYQESKFGYNTGQCYVTDFITGDGTDSQGVKKLRIMSPTRDIPFFLDIVRSLGGDPKKMPVSCWIPMYSAGKPHGWGGAMGPAMYIPSSWNLIKGDVENLIGRVANPWAMKDAFVAVAVFLKKNGAVSDPYTATCRYYAGQCNTAGKGYANTVMAKMKLFQNDLNILYGQ